MKKSDFIAVFKNAKLMDARYIGMKFEIRGCGQSEVVIIQKEDFDSRLADYKAIYNNDMILRIDENVPISRIVDVAQGWTFKDIEYQLMSVGCGWKKPISDAIDRVYDRMIAENPVSSEEERVRCETMKEAVKGKFLTESRTELEAKFILDNIDKYEEIFDICMNGSDLDFRKGLVELQRMQNEYMLKEENGK